MKLGYNVQICDICCDENNWEKEIDGILENALDKVPMKKYFETKDTFWKARVTQCADLYNNVSICKKHLEQILKGFPGD